MNVVTNHALQAYINTIAKKMKQNLDIPQKTVNLGWKPSKNIELKFKVLKGLMNGISMLRKGRESAKEKNLWFKKVLRKRWDQRWEIDKMHKNQKISGNHMKTV